MVAIKYELVLCFVYGEWWMQNGCLYFYFSCLHCFFCVFLSVHLTNVLEHFGWWEISASSNIAIERSFHFFFFFFDWKNAKQLSAYHMTFCLYSSWKFTDKLSILRNKTRNLHTPYAKPLSSRLLFNQMKSARRIVLLNKFNFFFISIVGAVVFYCLGCM